MQQYSFSIQVRIWHPNIDPAFITEKLGITPDVTAKAGNVRTTPKGNPLSGTYAESYWHASPFNRGECSSTDYLAEDLLIEVLTILKPHQQFLLLLREQGARIHLQISSFSGRNYAFEFSPEFLSDCASIGVSLVHDVYSCQQN